MNAQILVGTSAGLWDIVAGGPVAVEALAGRDVVALAREGVRTLAIVDGHDLWATYAGGPWEPVAAVEGPSATCLAATAGELLVGTEQAHLRRLVGSRIEPVPSFESIEGRETWYTPWGDPADVRSIAVDRAGAIYVNVHVGGVVRSRDGGRDLDAHARHRGRRPSGAGTSRQCRRRAGRSRGGLRRESGRRRPLGLHHRRPARALSARGGRRGRPRAGDGIERSGRTAVGPLPAASRRHRAVRAVPGRLAPVVRGQHRHGLPGRVRRAWSPSGRPMAACSARSTPAPPGIRPPRACPRSTASCLSEARRRGYTRRRRRHRAPNHHPQEGTVKLLFFDDFKLGVLKGDLVVDVSSVVKDIPRLGPQDVIRGVIERFADLRRPLEDAASRGQGVPVGQVQRAAAAAQARQHRLHGRELHGGRDAERARAHQRVSQVAQLHHRPGRHHGAARRPRHHLRGRGRDGGGDRQARLARAAPRTP